MDSRAGKCTVVAILYISMYCVLYRLFQGIWPRIMICRRLISVSCVRSKTENCECLIDVSVWVARTFRFLAVPSLT